MIGAWGCFERRLAGTSSFRPIAPSGERSEGVEGRLEDFPGSPAAAAADSAGADRRLRDFRRAALKPAWDGAAQRVDFPPDASRVVRLCSVVASYAGHLRRGASFSDWRNLLDRHRWVDALFAPDECDVWRFHMRWPAGVLAGGRFSRQYARLIRRAGDRALVFCEVGRYVEFHGPQRERATGTLRLTRATLGRAGYAFGVGFPTSYRAEYLSRAVRSGWVVADVREVGRLTPRCAERAIVAVWCPAWERDGADGASPSTEVESSQSRVERRWADPSLDTALRAYSG